MIAALDRRIPRPDGAAESAIARDAASVRARAVARLAEVSRGLTSSAPAGLARADTPLSDTQTTGPTPFPATPADVAVLTVQEFTFDIDAFEDPSLPSMERICRTFMDDANRALAWWIRFGALRAWRATADVTTRSMPDTATLRDAREVAASFPLNPAWEFDRADFGRAVDRMALRRRRPEDMR